MQKKSTDILNLIPWRDHKIYKNTEKYIKVYKITKKMVKVDKYEHKNVLNAGEKADSTKIITKNPAHGTHWNSQPMRIVARIP